MRTRLTALLVFFLFAALAQAAELRPPAQATAGTPFSIASSGAGEGTFYLIGPAHISKRKVGGGGEIAVQGDEVEQEEYIRRYSVRINVRRFIFTSVRRRLPGSAC